MIKLILKDSQLLSSKIVEADMRIKIVKWGMCCSRDGGINHGAKEGSGVMREKSEKASQKKRQSEG